MIECDVLVIGGGGAGARAALEAKRRGAEVCLVTKGKFGETGSTNFIASETLGINAAFGYADERDNPEVHLKDTIETGLGLCNEKMARILAYEACDRIKELMEIGMEFDKNDKIKQKKLSGCTYPRSLSFKGATGRKIVHTLKNEIIKEGIEIFEDTRILDIILDGKRVAGALGYSKDFLIFKTKSIILACGGAGGIFSKNINPKDLTGDGYALGYKAGASLVNMEFIQVGPGLVFPKIKFIIHSYMWRFKPKLYNSLGEEFLGRYCDNPEKVLELKAMSFPFSVRTEAKYLDIAVFKEIIEGRGTENGGVYLDVSHVSKEDLKEKAPVTYNTILNGGVDIANERVEIAPLVQTFNGGVSINERTETDIEGLFAAGETAGGVHGADRPGGNSLIDCQVFGRRAGLFAYEYSKNKKFGEIKNIDEKISRYSKEGEYFNIEKIKELFWRNLTIIRNEEGLKEVLRRINSLKNENIGFGDPNKNSDFENMLIVGEIIAKAALARKESRGTHYREDYPHTDEKFRKRIFIRK